MSEPKKFTVVVQEDLDKLQDLARAIESAQAELQTFAVQLRERCKAPAGWAVHPLTGEWYPPQQAPR